MSYRLDLTEGWAVLQDVHGLAEAFGVYRPEWNPYDMGAQLSVWEPIERLTHLQLLFAKQPYFGRELRYFNEHSWWYRVEFEVPAEAPKYATLRFEGVDYFAKVWLNGELLGEHEGYIEPFSFDVTKMLRRDGPNVLVVCVSSPWDGHVRIAEGEAQYVHCERNLLKGTYEHADTFVQRDVNPVGIWRPVRVLFDDGVRSAEEPHVVATLSNDIAEAKVAVMWPVTVSEGKRAATLRLRVFSEESGLKVASARAPAKLSAGVNALTAEVTVTSPRLWSTWERSGPSLYTAKLEVLSGDEVLLAESVSFGIRNVDIRRTAEETTFLLNGRPMYLRGTSYFPDVYVSKMDRGRYERDLQAMVRAGMNAVRVHVHTENRAFYEICDRLGLVVFQDFDWNWTTPVVGDPAFVERAVTGLKAMMRFLRNHPSVACWLTMNEVWPDRETPHSKRMAEEARAFDPTRPIIANTGMPHEPNSGDYHEYRGSLGSGEYTDIFGSTEKLNTEHGVDTPPGGENARTVPEMWRYLRQLRPRLAELTDYSYRLLKYYLEHYRTQKYAPCSGHFQFLWIDICPPHLMGVYDYWGVPKVEGLGGPLRALMESNQPVGIFMEYKDAPGTVWAVNDLLTDYGKCRAEWTVTTTDGALIQHDSAEIALGPDSRVKVTDLSFPVTSEVVYRIVLNLYAPDGARLAHNVYEDPFHHPARLEPHPRKMDHEVGMRTWWAR